MDLYEINLAIGFKADSSESAITKLRNILCKNHCFEYVTLKSCYEIGFEESGEMYSSAPLDIPKTFDLDRSNKND